MVLELKPRAAQWLLCAAVVFAVAPAYAVSGFTVTHEQELQVTAGMSAGQVQQVLGSSSLIKRVGNECGPTWIYKVSGAGTTITDRVFLYVEFGVDGRVRRVHEVWIDDARDVLLSNLPVDNSPRSGRAGHDQCPARLAFAE